MSPIRAARLQARLIERAVSTACAARIGPVTVWATPDPMHAIFETLRIRHDALNRESYVPGVAAAVREIGQQPPGLIIGLEQILGIA